MTLANPFPATVTAPATLPEVDEAMGVLVADALDDAQLRAAAAHHLGKGGKRLRASLALETAWRLTVAPSEALAIAAAVELLHEASLLHDDLQDRTTTRRGAPTVWCRFGDDTALLLGDVMIAAAFAAIATLPPTGVDRAVLTAQRAVARTASGQSRDRRFGGDTAGDLDAYRDLAREKCAPLFALPLQLVFQRLPDEAAAATAAEAAGHFAVAYQLADDVGDRDADALAAAAPNAVLLLEARGLARSTAEAEIRARVQQHLARADALAATLPQGAGAPLRGLTSKLRRETCPWT